MNQRVKIKWMVLLISVCVLVTWWLNASSFPASRDTKTPSTVKHEPLKPLIAPTPPMGWNSWNHFHCNGLHEDVVRGVADAIVNSGLAKAGYVYVNLDDCWQIDRNASGYIVEDPKKFPSGMKALGDYLHSKGLKFGIYTCIGSATCQKRPGSLFHEKEDIASYLDWGVDFIKNDDCFLYPGMTHEEGYARFSTELRKAPKPIILSCKATVRVSHAPKYVQIRRVGADVYPEWGSVISILDKVVSNRLWESGRPGFWHDMDMLEVGNGRMTQDEYVCHMILWCAFKSPLLLGNDVRRMSSSTLSLLAHRDLLAINQDPLGEMVQLVWQGPPQEPGDSSSSSGAALRVVSAPCDVEDPAQQWRIQGLLLQSMGKPGMCLQARQGVVQDRLIAVIAKCDNNDQMQHWRINPDSKQIELVAIPGKCLTTNTAKHGINAHIRGCNERQSIPGYEGPNKRSQFFNDAFDITNAGKDSLVFVNAANKCPRVGDNENEIQIFAGRLSRGRLVAVLLNRGETEHQITLRWEHFNTLADAFSFVVYNALADVFFGMHIELQDVYLGTNLGKLNDHYTTSVPPHGAKMIMTGIIYQHEALYIIIIIIVLVVDIIIVISLSLLLSLHNKAYDSLKTE